MLLSVVVPVFNVEAYVGELADTLTTILHEDAEVIFVDDCSKDGSVDVIHDWLSKNENFKDKIKIVSHNENMGLSQARNTGISNASGEYIWCVDSDDLVNNNNIDFLFKVMRQQRPDVVMFDFYFLHRNGKDFFYRNGKVVENVEYSLRKPKNRSLKPKNILGHEAGIIQSIFSDLRIYAWSYIVKSKLYKNIRYPVGSYFEDISTIPSIIVEASSFYYIPEGYILYRQREGSIMSSKIPRKDLDMVRAMSFNEPYFVKNYERISESDRIYWRALQLQTYVWGVKDLSKNKVVLQRDYLSEIYKYRGSLVNSIDGMKREVFDCLKRYGRNKDYYMAKVSYFSPVLFYILLSIYSFSLKARRKLF